ncbi:UNVERIFIED_CONTAM: hypothetical protein B566_EDAN019053, partial [Ephemera danica]
MEKFRFALETIKLDALTSYDQEMGTWIRDYKGPCDMKRFNENHNCTITRALDKFANSQFDKDDKIYKSVVDSTKKSMNESYATYIVVNCALRTQHFSTLYTNFERTIKMKLSKFQDEILVSWQQDLQQKIKSITDECLKSILQEKDDSKVFSELLTKAKNHIKEVENDLLSKNDRKMQAERESIQKAINGAINDYKSEMNSNIISLATIPEDPQVVSFHEPAKSKALKNLEKALSHITIEVPENCVQIAEEGIQAALEKFRTDSNFKKREKRTRQGKAGCPVGIDLGTTYSCVSVYRNGKFERIKNTYDDYTTPSVVYYTANEPIVGEEAILKGQTDSRNCISGI